MDSFPHLSIDVKNGIAVLRLDRPEKRNAVNDALIGSIEGFFRNPPSGVRVAVLHGAGDHFCAGLDLSEHRERDAVAVMAHSQAWHRVFQAVQFGGLPVVSALHGAVIGGGLELATATHVRVADRTAFYALPEGQRGIFVGGGATVRVARIIGAGRMVEMMLTGRTYDAEDGLRLGLSHYLEEPGRALGKALELAERIAGNAPLSTYAILNAISRIEDMSMADGLFTESLVAALVQTSGDARARLEEFLDKRAGKVGSDPRTGGK